MNYISSSQNQIIKEVRCLKDKKHRDAKKMFFIEGIRFVQEAMEENVNILKILISEKLEYLNGGKQILKSIKQRDIPVFELSDKLFKEISDTDNPQGILAIINMKEYLLYDVFDDKNFFIVLDSIQDPGNMGTIIRTADAAGATAVLISKGCVDVYNPKVLRSTMGSIFHLPICFCKDMVKDLQDMKNRGIKLCAAHLEGQLNYYDLNYKDNVAVIVGNEANGVSDSIREISTDLVKIPMEGGAESLNASVAAGLLMFEVMRNRVKK
ncbi:UNVERIFIED_CONTAM: TrmH family RNA methyltransferase [Acetivibrio alkalicellulosi]